MNATVARLIVATFAESVYEGDGIDDTTQEGAELLDYLRSLVNDYKLEMPEWLLPNWPEIEAQRDEQRRQALREENAEFRNKDES